MKTNTLLCGILGVLLSAGAFQLRAIEVRNGSLSNGGDTPEGWTEKYVYGGSITIARDTNVYFTTPAALRVSGVGGDASGQAQQLLDVKPGEKFHVEARVLAEGAKGLFGVTTYDAKWKAIEFKALGNAWSGSDWRHAAGDVEIPPNAVRMGLSCAVEGRGSAWFDDIRVVPAGVKSADIDGTAATKPPATAIEDALKPPPRPANAWSPGEGFWKDYPQAWRQTADGQIARAGQGGIELVFIGDSLTQGWDKDLWAQRYAPRKAVNFGIGGDGTPQVLWRIEHGLLDGFAAKAVVLMIGINNMWPGYSVEDSARGITACVEAIRAKQPKARIVLLGVLPAFDAGNEIRTKVRGINEAVAKLADGVALQFLDMGGLFLQPDGELKTELFQSDKLHLAPAGYQVWSDAMEPLLKAALAP